MKEKFFAILNQDGEVLCDVQPGAFTVGVREFCGDYFLVGVFYDGEEYYCGIYRELDEATAAVSQLMTFEPTDTNTAFLFPTASEPVSGLEIVDVMNAQGVICHD